jgi:hypothetical protein
MSRTWHRLKIGIVSATFSLCGAAFIIRPTLPRRAPDPRPQELYQIVMQELAAVREADYSRAYRHVSLSMRERYNLDDFTEHVRMDHPELSRFERAEFGAVSTQGRHALVPVYLFLRTGEIALVHYTLVRELGTWKIDGSRLGQRWGRDHRVGGERT